MADSEVFDFVCEQLESQTTLDRLEARGTVRITLKQAGLDVRAVSVQQMSVAIEKLLPSDLESRGVEGVAQVCTTIASNLSGLTIAPNADTPEAVFERLGG